MIYQNKHFKYLVLLNLSITFNNTISSSIVDNIRHIPTLLQAMFITQKGLDRAFENQNRELLNAVQKLRPKTILTDVRNARLHTEIEKGRSANIDWLLSRYEFDNRYSLNKAIEKQNFYAIAAIINLQPNLICDIYDFYSREVHKEILRCVPEVAKSLLDKFDPIRSIETKKFLNKILENEVKKDAKDQSIKILELLSNLMLHKKYIPEGIDISQNAFLVSKLRKIDYASKSHLAFSLPLSCIDAEDMDEHIKNLVEKGLTRHSHVVDKLLTLKDIKKSRKSVDALLSNGALDKENLLKLLERLVKIENCNDILDKYFEIFLRNKKFDKLDKILQLYNLDNVTVPEDLWRQLNDKYAVYKLIKEKIASARKKHFVRPPIENKRVAFFDNFEKHIERDYKKVPQHYQNPIFITNLINYLDTKTNDLNLLLTTYETELKSCSICCNDNPKFVTLCSNNHFICAECVFNLESESCPFCRENIYKRFSTCMKCNKEQSDCKLLTCNNCNQSSIICLSCIMQGATKHCCNNPLQVTDFHNIRNSFNRLINIFIEKCILRKDKIAPNIMMRRIMGYEDLFNLFFGVRDLNLISKIKAESLSELKQLYSLLHSNINYTITITIPSGEQIIINKDNLNKLIDWIFE